MWRAESEEWNENKQEWFWGYMRTQYFRRDDAFLQKSHAHDNPILSLVPRFFLRAFLSIKLRVAESLVKRNVSRKLTFLHNTVTWRHWIAPWLNSDRFCAVIETASDVWGSVIRKDVEMEESDDIFIVIFFTRYMIYVIISSRQVCSTFILKFILLFDPLNEEKSFHEK